MSSSMAHIGVITLTPNTYFRPFILPQPPSAPDFTSSAEAAAEVAQGTAQPAERAVDPQDSADTPQPAKTKASIGMSSVVMEFLLKLQELGLNSIPGTDGDDKLSGWSGSLVDAGDGDDTVNVWAESVVDSGTGADTIRAWSDSRIHAGAGDDRIDVWSGSTVDAGSGDDVVNAWSDTVVDGGAGNDRLSGWSGSRVDGGEGDDQISVWSNSIAHGGAGNDKIFTQSGGVVSGGQGDDLIAVGVDSVVNFAKGDGHDDIYAELNTVVKLGAGFTPDKTHVTVEGHTATITFDGSDDRITLHLGPRGPATLAFADGTLTEVAAEADARWDAPRVANEAALDALRSRLQSERPKA